MHGSRNLEGGHIEVPNAINIEIEGHRIRTEDQRNEDAADMTGAASFTDAQDRSTQHEGHRDTANDTQRKVVKRGKNKVWQRGRHIASSGIELSNTRMWGYERVNHQDRDSHHDDGRKDADHSHDSIKIQESCEHYEHSTQRATQPRRQTKLLFKVCTCTRKHHEAHREGREHENHIDDATQSRPSDLLKDDIVIIGTIVRAQLQGDCTKNDVEDTQCRNPNQAYRTVREEVLE